jgi:transcriptional regulator with XRE-family HTH domain
MYDYSIFEKLCKDHGVNASKVSSATGIATSTFSAWKKGDYTPKTQKLKKIADYFGVSIAYLMTGENDLPQDILDQNEAEMERLHRAAFRPEMELLIDTVKDAPDDVLIRLRYYAEGLIAGRKDN